MSVLFLNACSTMPSGPSILVLPGSNQGFERFRNDNLACKQTAHAQIESSPKVPDSKQEAQQDYDISYIQCMYSKGHRVPVPGNLMFGTQKEWHAPPPPNMPAPPQIFKPAPPDNSSQ
jgi:hypothetical protein